MRIEYLIYEVFQSYRNDFGSQFVLCHTLLFTSLRSKKSMHSSSEVEERDFHSYHCSSKVIFYKGRSKNLDGID